MNKLMLIMRHEFIYAIRRWSFIILTISFPLLGLLGIVAFQVIQHWQIGPFSETVEEQRLGYVDQTGRFTDYTQQENFTFVPYDSEEEAKSALLNEEVKEYFIIPENYLSTGVLVRYTMKMEFIESKTRRERLEDFLLSNLLARETSPQIIERVKSPLTMLTLMLDETGQVTEDTGEFGAVIVPYFFAILLAVSIFTSSGFLLQGVSEEKESRVIEILLSSVSARQLLTGKVLGLGAAGLLQIAVWLITARLLVEVASTSFADILGAISISTGMLVLCVVYFVLGYLLFAILMAAVGSIGSTAREGQQLGGIFTFPAIIPLMLSSFVMYSPDNILFRVLSLFPVTAPIMVMERLAVAEVPLWEIALSIAILVISILVAMWLAGKIFRTCLLMYGKRPGLREITRYIREA